MFSFICSGFHFVCDNPVLKLLRPEELQLLINGQDTNLINICAMKKCCKYKDFTKVSLPTIGMLWEALQDFGNPQKQKFLSFLTGSDRLPIGGFEVSFSMIPFKRKLNFIGVVNLRLQSTIIWKHFLERSREKCIFLSNRSHNSQFESVFAEEKISII